MLGIKNFLDFISVCKLIYIQTMLFVVASNLFCGMNENVMQPEIVSEPFAKNFQMLSSPLICQ